MGDLFNQPISRATIIEAERQLYQKLEPIEESIVQQLLGSPAVHFDESGLQVNGKGQWLHVASTETLTHYTVHPKRGMEGMDAGGVLPDFNGTAIHDAWKPYFKYTACDHALCHAHHLRELTGIYEQEQGKQLWAKDMIDLLLEMKETVETEGILDITTVFSFEQRYDDIIERGLEEDKRLNPPVLSPKGKRGRKKQSPAKNLLDRLQTYRTEALGFIRNPYIPFDNNQAERDVRMIKVQQKVSGTFRDSEGAGRFGRIRGFVSTMKKQSHSVMEALHSVFTGDPVFPDEKNK
jgi:transposase